MSTPSATPQTTPLEALVELAAAASPAALRAAHQRLSAALRAGRRQVRKSDSVLANSIATAVRIWESEKAAGVPEADRLASLEKTVRAAWPFTREWKYVCQACDDTGLRMQVCRAGFRCGARLCALNETYTHDYGTPCWCDKGKRFRPAPTPTATDFQAAGKTSKRSGFSRMGR